ncbi:MAG: hypothetical protein WBW04_02730 [Nitrolancea sp.]
MSSTSTTFSTRPDSLLRRSLTADAVVVTLAGLVLALGAGELADPLGLSVSLLRFTGLGLLPYAAALMLIATRSTISRAAAWTVIALNLLWTVASILLLFTGWIDPTGLGVAFVLIQALLVLGFADVEYLGLRRASIFR